MKLASDVRRWPDLSHAHDLCGSMGRKNIKSADVQGSAVMLYIKKDMSTTQCVLDVSVSAFHVPIIMPISLLPETGKVKHRDITCLKTQASKQVPWLDSISHKPLVRPRSAEPK